jgi:hypothetical protein
MDFLMGFLRTVLLGCLSNYGAGKTKAIAYSKTLLRRLRGLEIRRIEASERIYTPCPIR